MTRSREMFDLFKKKASFGQLGFVADCHCHILPAVDDGVRSHNEAFLVLRQMIKMGVKSVVLTPHLNPDVYPDTNESFMRSRFDEFIDLLPEDIVSSLHISLGAEYMVTTGFEKRDFSQLLQFMPGKVLIEMSYFYPSKNMEQTIFNLLMEGLEPVIAHPERYLYYAQRKDVFERYHDMGAKYQMNLISLSGAYGKDSMSILKCILDNGWYSLVASDAHNIDTLSAIQNIQFDSSLLDGCRKLCDVSSKT